MTQTTAAANSGNAASPGAASPSAGNGLSELLQEFDQPTGGTPAAPIPDPIKRLAPLINWAADEIKAKEVGAAQKDVDSAVTFMTEAPELKDVPKRVIRGLIEGWGSENPVLKAAFDNRKADPGALKKALEDCRSAILEDWKSLPGNKVRTDVEAAVLAARGTSTSPNFADLPSNADMWNMNRSEWKKFTDQQLSKARS